VGRQHNPKKLHCMEATTISNDTSDEITAKQSESDFDRMAYGTDVSLRVLALAKKHFPSMESKTQKPLVLVHVDWNYKFYYSLFSAINTAKCLTKRLGTA
jgi:hypothetical protein